MVELDTPNTTCDLHAG